MDLLNHHWESKRIKHLYEERVEKNSDSKNDYLSIVKDVGVIPYSEKGNVGNKTSDNPENYKRVYPNDLVINPMNVTIGSVGISSCHGCLSNIYMVLKPRIEFAPQYYGYVFQIKSFQKSLRKISYGIMEIRESINKIEFFGLELPYPPLSEQQQIVSFLDTKTSLIDSLIEKTQRKIELLKEKRTSLINELVTKGLNPNVEMKDSGVEWIGEIPSHWVESQFKYYIKLRHGHQFRDGDFTEEGIKIIKITQLDKGGFLNLSNCTTIDKERLTDFEDILIFENDILMCLTGGTIGKIIKVGKVDEPLLQNYRVGHFSPIDSKSMGNNYMFYLMSSEVIIGQIFYDVRETGQPNIGMEDMNRMRICIPPISEQQKIVVYLDEQTQLIDKTVSFEKKRIELLKEYRQSLISEVVTGKRKVVE